MIDEPPFNVFPNRHDLLKKQGKRVSVFTQLDSLQDEVEEGRMEDEEEEEVDKSYEVPMKRKYTFFPSKNADKTRERTATAESGLKEAKLDSVKEAELDSVVKTESDVVKTTENDVKTSENEVVSMATAESAEMDRVEEDEEEADKREDNLNVDDQHLAVVIDQHDIKKNMKTWERKGEELIETIRSDDSDQDTD